MSLTEQSIRIGHHNPEEGVLFFEGDLLIAVFSCLSAQHEDRAGWWYMECGFGAASVCPEEFATLDAARSWVEDRLAG